MNTRRASTKLHNVKTTAKPGWGPMLLEVEKEIYQAKQRLADLERSEKTLKDKIGRGEPFPASLVPSQN